MECGPTETLDTCGAEPNYITSSGDCRGPRKPEYDDIRVTSYSIVLQFEPWL